MLRIVFISITVTKKFCGESVHYGTFSALSIKKVPLMNVTIRFLYLGYLSQVSGKIPSQGNRTVYKIMAGLIANEVYAANIGGGSGALSGKCCTAARAVALGCKVANGYTGSILVAQSSLSKAISYVTVTLTVPSSIYTTTTGTTVASRLASGTYTVYFGGLTQGEGRMSAAVQASYSGSAWTAITSAATGWSLVSSKLQFTSSSTFTTEESKLCLYLVQDGTTQQFAFRDSTTSTTVRYYDLTEKLSWNLPCARKNLSLL